jgi:hypothetical protein
MICCVSILVKQFIFLIYYTVINIVCIPILFYQYIIAYYFICIKRVNSLFSPDLPLPNPLTPGIHLQPVTLRPAASPAAGIPSGTGVTPRPRMSFVSTHNPPNRSLRAASAANERIDPERPHRTAFRAHDGLILFNKSVPFPEFPKYFCNVSNCSWLSVDSSHVYMHWIHWINSDVIVA